MALVASASEPISTKANPLDLPVALSMMRTQLTTLPDCLNKSETWLSVVLGDRFPTYSFVAIAAMLGNPSPARHGVFTPWRDDAPSRIIRVETNATKRRAITYEFTRN